LIGINQKNIKTGIHTIAIFEAFKGLIVLIAGFALLQLLHGELQIIADRIVKHLHMNPLRHNPHLFLDAIAGISDSKLRLFAAYAFTYSILRFVEAYGLWHYKTWAEWFAILSGGIYIPIEILGLFRHATIIKGIVFIINLAIVMFLIYIRLINRKPTDESEQIQSTN
jgi:uncharacterized membrane protein (DUF2068 family)